MLGFGGFGLVLGGVRVSDGRAVAIKITRAGFDAGLEALERERQALAKLGPPLVPELYGAGTLADGSAYLALELVAAHTLSSLMERTPGPWPLARFAPVARGVATSLAAVHRAGLVHRDVKPENFFVGFDGASVRVFDFGLVAAAGTLPSADKAGEGTPEYMPAEQDAADQPIARTADVYAAGAMLYELLTGAPPFFGDPAEVREGHRSQRPARMAAALGVPQPLEDLVLRCLAKDPTRRFADADALLVALDEAFAAIDVAPAREAAVAVAATAQAAAAPAKAEQRTLAVLLARPRPGKAIAAPEVKRLGGELASASPVLGVAIVFSHDASENPARRAYDAAARLIETGLVVRALVHLMPVSIQARPNGARRYVAAAFAKPDFYPSDREPEGVLVTRAALELLPNVEVDPVPNRDGWSRVRADEKRELTVVGAGPGRLFGRDEELATLIRSVRDAARESRPTVAVVTAVNGLGKSELAASLIARLAIEQPDASVMALRCQEALAGSDSRVLRELLRRALKLPREMPDDRGRAAVTGLLGPDAAWAAVAFAMGWLPGEAPEVAELLAAPGALRAAVAKAAGEGLRLLAKRQPVCVLLDDAQLADEITLDAVEYAALREGAARIWVGAFARPSFSTARELFGSRAGDQLRLELAPLAIEAQMTLARVLLAPVDNVPAAALRKIAERTRGNPHLLVELVRGLKRDGVVQRTSKGEYQLATELIDRLPELPAVQWLATREIEALPPDLAAHARLAAVLGPELSERDLEGVLELAERERRDLGTKLDGVVGLRRLLSAGILVRHRSGRVSFRYEVLRDATYDLVPVDRRSEIHDVAYRWLLDATDLPEHERLPRLAQHAARSGRRNEAIEAYLALADRARMRHSYLEAEGLYVQALQAIEAADDPRRLPAVKGQAQMRFRQGRYESALKLFDESIERARALGDALAEVEIQLDLGTVFDFLHDFNRSRLAYEAAAQQATSATRTPLIEARLRYAHARVDYRFSRVREAVVGMLEAAAAAERVGPEGYETLIECLEIAGTSSASIGELDQAAAIFDRAFALCAAHGDRLHEVSTYINRAFLWLPASDFDKIRVDYERALVISREHAFSFQEAMLVQNLAEVSYLLGDLPTADRHAERAIELGERLAGHSMYYIVLQRLLRARIRIMSGELAAAREFLDSADRIVSEALAAKDPVVFTPSDQVLRDMVDLATRDASDADWDSLLARSREVSVQSEPVETHAVRGLIALRQGRGEFARDALRAAMELAQRIPNTLTGKISEWLGQVSAAA